MSRRVAVVPHTHWDREWYLPFQQFRLKLVEVVDAVLDLLESDPSFSHFLLDGQMAAVDDYLEVRPEAADRIRRLVGGGRLSIGPWYVLPDEFLVSGETLVRNLEFGLAGAAPLGGPMEVGYLPDMFGHVAQMPQLLRQAGFDHAVVWRGVPSAVDRTAFWWRAPDGSTVRAEYLPVGYGNGAAAPVDAERFVERVAAHEAELGALLPAGTPMLWMNGGDHQAPQPWVGRVVDEADHASERFDFEVTSLPGYLSSARRGALPSWDGELRSGARANLLMGVASNRVDVKQAAAAAERALERRAEPLCALLLPEDEWPSALLKVAWRQVLRNAAHDSVCACSADEVVEAVLERYSEARQIGDGLAAKALGTLASTLPQGWWTFNPSARTRSGLVELVLPWESSLEGLQPLDDQPPLDEQFAVSGRGVGALVSQKLNKLAAEATLRINGVKVARSADQLDVTLDAGIADDEPTTTASDLSDLYARAGAHGEKPAIVRVRQEGYRRALVHVNRVPGFGWKRPALSSGRRGDAPPPVEVTAGGGGRPTVVANGLVRLQVDPADGTLSLDGVAGLNRLVDSGDAGDTYNYSPPERDVVAGRPERTTVDVIESGPLRATVAVTRSYFWPDHIAGPTRTGERAVDVTSTLSLHAGERLVRITTAFENLCRDHRLRAVFPLPRTAAKSTAECAFATVERRLEAEGGPHERGLPTFPSRRFVVAGGLTVVHDGLLEYELVDNGKALALTLLRCVGVLSGTDLAYRPLPAGPPVAVEGAQMLGRQVLRYGVMAEGDPRAAYAAVDNAFLPLEAVAGRAAHSGLGDSGRALEVSGAEVSAVRRVAGQLEVRLFNPTPAATTVRMPGRKGALVDLRGRPVGEFSESFPMGPWCIATARLWEARGPDE
jgi:hypothetical protein